MNATPFRRRITGLGAQFVRVRDAFYDDSSGTFRILSILNDLASPREIVSECQSCFEK